MVIGGLFSLETELQNVFCRQSIPKQRHLFYTLPKPEICLWNIKDLYACYYQLHLYRSFMLIRISQASSCRLQLLPFYII